MSSEDESPAPVPAPVAASPTPAWPYTLLAVVEDARDVNTKEQLSDLLEKWIEIQDGSTRQLVSLLDEMSTLMEKETEEYYKADPDPFDDRHPGRVDPDRMLGQLLKMILLNDGFTKELVDTYIMTSREHRLNAAGCRLLQSICMGLENAVFLERDGLPDKLFKWACEAGRPLCIYAMGLLGRALNNQELVARFREENIYLVPIMINRLHELQAQEGMNHFRAAHTSSSRPQDSQAEDAEEGREGGKRRTVKVLGRKAKQKLNYAAPSSSAEASKPQISSSFSLSPLNPAIEQRLILQYLTPLGAQPELLAIFKQLDILSLLMNYIDLRNTRNVQLTFDALLFLSSLFVHKKLTAEFIAHGGVQRLLEIPRPSMAATGVSLCLQHLAHNQEAMEMVCTLPDGVLSNLVAYALWLLESSHTSGICHATMFFSYSFPFRAVLLLFDHQDGLRRLTNLLSMSEILRLKPPGQGMTDDEVFTNRQTIKYTCNALRRYFEAHLSVKAQQVKRSQRPSGAGASMPEQLLSKAYSYTREQITEMMELLIKCGPSELRWEPVEAFCSLSGVSLMLQIIRSAYFWKNYSGRSDAVRYVLDVLAIVAVVPKAKLMLTELVKFFDGSSSPLSARGMNIIQKCADGEEFVNEPEIQKSAVQVMVNCVSGPDRSVNSVGTFAVSPQQPSAPHNRVRAQMCEKVQNSHGIMLLLSLLKVTSPISDADQLRALACKALLGLSYSPAVRQIFSKLPLFTSGQLQQLMKEPVLLDKRHYHIRFCQYASELTKRVFDKPVLAGPDVSLAHLQKANVVAQSCIHFSERELLMLVRNHLVAKGLHNAANALVQEANLPIASLCTDPSSSPVTPLPSTLFAPRVCRVAGGTGARITSHTEGSPVSSVSLIPSCSRSLASPQPSCSFASACPPPPHPSPEKQEALPVGRPLASEELPTASYNLRRVWALNQKSDHAAFIQTHPEHRLSSPLTLDGIVTEYLREQHARCPNPITTCPPFSLFSPHRCPEPTQRLQASLNFTARLGRKMLYSKYGGVDQEFLDRRLVFSRFRQRSLFHAEDRSKDGLSACAFSACGRFLMVGTSTGHLKYYNIFSGEEEATFTCHTTSLTHIQPSRDGRLLLTCGWTTPTAALWSLDTVLRKMYEFDEEHHVEFSKLNQNRVIGTQDSVAMIHDVRTRQRIMTLYDPTLANDYNRNAATFNHTDDLVLNDGVLWDVRTARAIHKFDKLNRYFNGVFHPNNLEIIINSEIWDMRTFRLLHTIPSLDYCKVVFNSTGAIMYAGILFADDAYSCRNPLKKNPLCSSFRVFDATNYKPITTLDLKRGLYYICPDDKDRYLALVESFDDVCNEMVCRLYDLGRHKLSEEKGDQDGNQDDGTSEMSHDDVTVIRSLVNNEAQFMNALDQSDEDVEDPPDVDPEFENHEPFGPDSAGDVTEESGEEASEQDQSMVAIHSRWFS